MKESILKIEDERVIGKSCSRLITLTTNKCPNSTLGNTEEHSDCIGFKSDGKNPFKL